MFSLHIPQCSKNLAEVSENIKLKVAILWLSVEEVLDGNVSV